MATIGEYLDRLAAQTPAPGGGSAAALVGAIGASLLSMVARYTAKKKILTSTVRAKISRISEFAERSSRRLKKLMVEDEKAYSRLSRVLAKKAVNKTRLYKNASAVPLEACVVIEKTLKKCEELSVHCKASIASDLVEAALILEAAFLSAKLNVEINLDGIKDIIYTRKVRKALSRLSASVPKGSYDGSNHNRRN